MATSEYDIRVSIQDVDDTTLLARLLKRVTGVLRLLGAKIDALAANSSSPGQASVNIDQIRADLQIGGPAPLNVEGLLGHLAQAQSAGLSVYPSTPSASVIQTLKSDQLVLVQGPPDTLKRVVTGAPSKLVDINVVPADMVTTDTNQTITGIKTFSSPPIGTQYVSVLTGNSSNSTIIASTTAYMPISGTQIPTMLDTVAGITQVIPISATAGNLYVQLDTNITGSVTITLMKNTVATSLVTTIAGANDHGHDTTHSVSIVAGDNLSIRVVTDGGAATCKYSWGITLTGTV